MSLSSPLYPISPSSPYLKKSKHSSHTFKALIAIKDSKLSHITNLDRYERFIDKAVEASTHIKTMDIFSPGILDYNTSLLLALFAQNPDYVRLEELSSQSIFDLTTVAIHSVHEYFNKHLDPSLKCLKLATMLLAINDLLVSHSSFSLHDIFQFYDSSWVTHNLSLFFVYDNSTSSHTLSLSDKDLLKSYPISSHDSFVYHPGRLIKLGSLTMELINSYQIGADLNKELGQGSQKRVRFSLCHHSLHLTSTDPTNIKVDIRSHLFACIKQHIVLMHDLLTALKEILINHTLAKHDRSSFDHPYRLNINLFSTYPGKYNNLVSFQKIATASLRPSHVSQRSPKTCYLLAQTLCKLHRLNIIHGDIKMDNFFISHDYQAAYLIDFGLSFHSNLKSLDSFLLTPSQLGGSHYPPWYVQYKGVEMTNPTLNNMLLTYYLPPSSLKKADVWSWAATSAILLSRSHSMEISTCYSQSQDMYINTNAHHGDSSDNPVFLWATHVVNELNRCQSLNASLKHLLIDCLSLEKHMTQDANHYYTANDTYPDMDTVLYRLSDMAS